MEKPFFIPDSDFHVCDCHVIEEGLLCREEPCPVKWAEHGLVSLF
jgi:hypothetical protein